MTGRYPNRRVFFALLEDGPDRIGVRLLESFLMHPIKTVSGIMFPTEEAFQSCMLCPRQDCPRRRAPYDPELYDRKYRSGAPSADAHCE